MFKTKKRTLTVILSLLLAFAFTVAAQAAEPVQDADGYYELATAEDMLWFREQVAQGAVDMNAKLTADIDLSGMSWQPIWYEDGIDDVVNFDPTVSLDYAYNGTFDGNGKTLILKIDDASLVEVEGGGRMRAGFFLYGNIDAVVKNLTLTGTMDISGTAQSDRIYAGFLGGGWRGVVYNCHVENATIQFANTATPYIAAFLPSIGAPTTADIEPAVIDSCTVDNVKIQTGANVNGGHIGLLVGTVSSGGIVQYSSVINGSSINFSSDSSSTVRAYAIGSVGTGTSKIRYCDVQDITIDVIAKAAIYIGGIARMPRGSIVGCTISDSKLWARGSTFAIGGIATELADSLVEVGEYGEIKDCIVKNLDIRGEATARSGLLGGIASHAVGAIRLQNNRSINNSLYGSLDGTTSTGTFVAATGGILGRSTGTPAANDPHEIIDCVVEDNNIQWLVSTDLGYNATIYEGGVFGYAAVPLTLENSVVLGGTISADASLMTSKRSILYIGGLVGQNNSAKVRNNTVALDTVSLQKGSHASSAIYAGALSGQMVGTDADANRAEHIGNRYGDDFFSSAYTWTALPGTAGSYDPAADPNKSTYCYESDNEAYDQDGLLLDTLFVLLGGISDPLTMQFGQSITIDPLASLGEAQYDGITVEPIATGIISAADNGDGTVTITATGVGTTSVYVSYMTASGMKTEWFNVTVTATPEYAYVTAVITGTPTDGIYLDDTVNLTYDFDPYVVIPEIDNTGMTLSGLLAAIVDGKVVVTGVARVAGTYSYVVTLQGADGSIITQTVYVTIEGSSRPTGNGTYGGGSSNCSAGFGATALLSLFGLALVMRKK